MASPFSQNNQRHFQSRSFGLDDFTQLGPADVLALEQYQPENEPIAASRRGRKRKIPLPEPTQEALPTPSVGESGLELSVARNVLDAMPDLPATPAASALELTVHDESHQLPCSTPAYIGCPDPHSLSIPNAAPMLSPSALSIGGQTPGGQDFHDDIAPNYLDGASPMHHGGMTPGYSADYGGAADAQSPAFTPSYAGGVTPHHGMMEQLDAIPNLPADQVSSILNGTGMENIGYGAMSERVANDWAEEYDFPPEVATHVRWDKRTRLRFG